MADIEIPNYRVLIPNSTFGIETKPVRNNALEKDVPATKVMQIVLYTVPTEDEVINLIQTAARECSQSQSTEEDQGESREIPLSEFIKMLPSDEIDKIAKAREDAIAHLRQHYTPGNYQPGKRYIEVINGRIPDEILELARDDLEKEGSILYCKIMEEINIREWHLKIRLDQRDSLPDRINMGLLLDNGVTSCDVFAVRGDYREYQNIAAQVKTLYDALSSPEKVRKVTDESDNALKTRAAKTIKEAARCRLAKKSLSNGLSEGFMGLMGILGQEPTQEKSPGQWPQHHNPN